MLMAVAGTFHIPTHSISGKRITPTVSEDKNKYRRHGSRFKARRRAVDILFEAEFRDLDPVKIVEERVELARDEANAVKPVPEYTATIVEGTATNLDAIDDAIAMNLASEWRLDRLPAVDRAVLRVATWELLFNDDVPNQVAMTEGIELAAQYSHDKAPAYVNAVLDGVARAADLKLADAAAAKSDASQEAADQGEDAELDALIGSMVTEDSAKDQPVAAGTEQKQTPTGEAEAPADQAEAPVDEVESTPRGAETPATNAEVDNGDDEPNVPLG